MSLSRTHLADFRGATRLVCDATVGLTDIVEQMHRTIQLRPAPVGRNPADRTSGITGLVYRAVRGAAQLIGKGVDAGLRPVATLLPAGESSASRDAYVSVLNGVYGDHLARSGNPLAMDMSLRHQGRTIEPERPPAALGSRRHPSRLLVLVHGLCLNDRHWSREGHDHGAGLADELAYAPLYLRYNTGLRITDNGRTLACLLERLVSHWPRPLEELAILGHSMGGLVAHSAWHHAARAGHAWRGTLRKLVFLGTPHHGAPLERGGHGLDRLLDVSPYSAPIARIGKSRSAGIIDLRHGDITGDPNEQPPLPDGVACYAAAATLAPGAGSLTARMVGDGLVPLDSALGIHRDARRRLAIPPGRQWVGNSTGHLELLNHQGLYAQLRAWLT